jgi:hypothetical protein
MLKTMRNIVELQRYFGLPWLARRGLYALRLRTGLVRRRIPARPWSDYSLCDILADSALADPEAYLEYRRCHAPPFFFEPQLRADYQRYFARWDEGGVTPLEECGELTRGVCHCFGHARLRTGFPPDWHADPFTGKRTPANVHWSRIGDFDHGDIRAVWELSRFSFAYALVRAYWRTGDSRHVEAFWRLVEDWREHNPPQRGANWKCGQEVSLRVMAWCFGLYGSLHDAATSAGRVGMLAQMIAVSGARIEANIEYALSQHNNHGISEGLGLWTIGALFPEFRQAPRWQARGRQVLEQLADELIYADGSFAQHSFNYHRLMLHHYVWALRLAELNRRPFSNDIRERIGAAGELLFQVQDERTGRVPSYGQNDGSQVLPLSNCERLDYRPAVQATHYLCGGARRYAEGPWDEDLLWLFGPESLAAPHSAEPRRDLAADMGGYYTLRSRDGLLFTRCAAFQHRPSQADMLHIDVWWRGQNVATDAGTYSYNAPAPWNNPLAGTAFHNTVSVDERDQMEMAGRFLWLPWLRGKVNARRCSAEGTLTYWEGEHDGYERLKSPVRHRRAIIRLPKEHWLVLDALASPREHAYRLHWLFPELAHEWDGEAGRLLLRTPAGPYHVRTGSFPYSGSLSLVRADDGSPRGWRAPYYGGREPAISVALLVHADSVYCWTLFGPGPSSMTVDGRTMHAKGSGWRTLLLLQTDEGKDLIAPEFP